jgi:hypothetical protein
MRHASPGFCKEALLRILAALFVLSSFDARPAPAAKIQDIAWEKLSDRDISPEGRLALSVNAKLWRHAETDHFVYHFTDENQAETVYLHAEVYYKWIKDLFGIREDAWRKKNHVFVFTDEGMWNDFAKKAFGGFRGDALTNGWELFLYREPHWLAPRRSLAHEMTHVIVFRFLNGPLPLFLNEGFSEFVSFRALAMQLGRSEYDIRTIELIEKKDFIPLEELIEAKSYPEDAITRDVFYRESELLVRYLILTYDSKKFYALLRDVSKGEPFRKVVARIYGLDFDTLEKKFSDYAVVRK